MTFAQALKHGTEKATRRDAMLLLSRITGKTSAEILLHEDNVLEDEGLFLDYLERLQKGEPLQYVIGQWDFMGLTFRTDSRALIPRPETELLAEEALKFIGNASKPVKVLDLCTGTGCIALAIASLAESVAVTAVDISPLAVSLARENALQLALPPARVRIIESDLFSEIAPSERFDVIISNPPYITSREMASLAPVVKDHEPHLALHGGTDGMDIYRPIVQKSLDYLTPGGVLLLEIGPAAVKDLMTEAGYENISLLQDYAGLDRIVKGAKPCLTV